MAAKTLLEVWYRKRHPWLSLALLPLAGLFSVLARLRRTYYRLKSPQSLALPIIVVGNINLGGSGKSPLLIALVKALRARDYSPGVISRGYGSQAPAYPYQVTPDSDTHEAGDEPVMIARRAGCPVVVDADRPAAARHLVASKSCDIILSDDGLQHYALPRDLEIVVVDGTRLLGNERLLPAGPLRESRTRLREVDWVFINGVLSEQERARLRDHWQVAHLFQMELRPECWRRIADGKTVVLEQRPWEGEKGGAVHAVAGIGNPERFFESLRTQGLTVIPHAFPDHHQFQRKDIDFADGRPVIMTEKDAVKCRELLAADDSLDRFWYLQVEAELEAAFYESLMSRLESLKPARLVSN